MKKINPKIPNNSKNFLEGKNSKEISKNKQYFRKCSFRRAESNREKCSLNISSLNNSLERVKDRKNYKIISIKQQSSENKRNKDISYIEVKKDLNSFLIDSSKKNNETINGIRESNFIKVQKYKNSLNNQIEKKKNQQFSLDNNRGNKLKKYINNNNDFEPFKKYPEQKILGNKDKILNHDSNLFQQKIFENSINNLKNCEKFDFNSNKQIYTLNIFQDKKDNRIIKNYDKVLKIKYYNKEKIHNMNNIKAEGHIFNSSNNKIDKNIEDRLNLNHKKVQVYNNIKNININNNSLELVNEEKYDKKLLLKTNKNNSRKLIKNETKNKILHNFETNNFSNKNNKINFTKNYLKDTKKGNIITKKLKVKKRNKSTDDQPLDFLCGNNKINKRIMLKNQNNHLVCGGNETTINNSILNYGQNNQDNAYTYQNDINIDIMTYEEILELQERIGYVCKGMKEENIKQIKEYEYKTNEDSSDEYLYVDYNKNQENICTICQYGYIDSEVIKELTCFHKYHSICLNKWLENSKLCPNCYKEIII